MTKASELAEKLRRMAEEEETQTISEAPAKTAEQIVREKQQELERAKKEAEEAQKNAELEAGKRKEQEQARKKKEEKRKEEERKQLEQEHLEKQQQAEREKTFQEGFMKIVNASDIITKTNEKVIKIETLLNEQNLMEKRYTFKDIENLKTNIEQKQEEISQKIANIPKMIAEKMASIPKTEAQPFGDPQFQAKLLEDINKQNKILEERLAGMISKEEFAELNRKLNVIQNSISKKSIEDYLFEVLHYAIVKYHSSVNKPRNTWMLFRPRSELARSLGISDVFWWEENVWNKLIEQGFLVLFPNDDRYIITPAFLKYFSARLDADETYGVKSLLKPENEKLGAEYYLKNLIDKKNNFLRSKISKFARQK